MCAAGYNPKGGVPPFDGYGESDSDSDSEDSDDFLESDDNDGEANDDGIGEYFIVDDGSLADVENSSPNDDDELLEEVRLDLSEVDVMDYRSLERVHVLVATPAAAGGGGGAQGGGMGFGGGGFGLGGLGDLFMSGIGAAGGLAGGGGVGAGGGDDSGAQTQSLFAFQVEESDELGNARTATALLAFESREDGEAFAGAMNAASGGGGEVGSGGGAFGDGGGAPGAGAPGSNHVFVSPDGNSEMTRAGLLELDTRTLADIEEQMDTRVLCVPKGTDLLAGLGPGGLAVALGEGDDGGFDAPDFIAADFDFQDPTSWRGSGAASARVTVRDGESLDGADGAGAASGEGDTAETAAAKLMLSRMWSLDTPADGGDDGLGGSGGAAEDGEEGADDYQI